MSKPILANPPRATRLAQVHTAILWAVLLLGGLVPSPLLAQVNELASYAAPNSNAIIFFNVNNVMKSSLASSNEWKENFDKAYASGLVAVPPTTASVMISSDLDVSSW